jgi:hypothetical protein
MLSGWETTPSRPAVHLDNQPLLAPEEVHLEAIDSDVHLGLEKAVAAAEREHSLFQLGPCAVAQMRCSSPTGPGWLTGGFWAAAKPIADGQAQELGLADGGVELGWGEEGADIGQGAPWLGHRNTVAACAVRRGKRGGAVKDDSPPLPLSGGAGTVMCTGSGAPRPPASDSRGRGGGVPKAQRRSGGLERRPRRRRAPPPSTARDR